MIEIHLEGSERQTGEEFIPSNLGNIVGRKLYTTNPNNIDSIVKGFPKMTVSCLVLLVILGLFQSIYGVDLSGILIILALFEILSVLDMVLGTQNMIILNIYPYIMEVLGYDKDKNEAEVRLYCRGMVTQFKANVSIEKLPKHKVCVLHFSKFKEKHTTKKIDDMFYNLMYSSIYLDDKYSQIFNLVTDIKG